MKKKLNDVLQNMMGAINIGQQIYLGEEGLDVTELSQNNGYIVLKITDGEDKYQYTYKLKQDDTEETIIRGLIDSVYQQNLLPLKREIKKAKKYLNRKIQEIYQCEYKLENLRNNQDYDLVKKSQLLAEEDVINHEIYLKYRELDSNKVDMEQFSIYKNILFESLKELKRAA
ncbi:hypothetical protein CLRAG_33620 [Clostridium ragsdalei P11]|uniref:Uncharacterized protein n=1 Tax=Clostridium ragsdalei P11 TaxID=1353534 RepID=A0A1A6AKW0_9CLOT|nr:hypothetical protein [Clostridium ragsdalei]OBR90714.1 hypothetical protein CLRAG_33620 [Clostridium ragsdalei P11]